MVTQQQQQKKYLVRNFDGFITFPQWCGYSCVGMEKCRSEKQMSSSVWNPHVLHENLLIFFHSRPFIHFSLIRRKCSKQAVEAFG